MGRFKLGLKEFKIQKLMQKKVACCRDGLCKLITLVGSQFSEKSKNNYAIL